MQFVEYLDGLGPGEILGEGVFSPLGTHRTPDYRWRMLEKAIAGTILTGTVVGIEGLETSFPYAVADWRGIPVRIPGEKLFAAPWDQDKPMPAEYQQQMSQMLGAIVDFVPYKVCQKESLALGDRSAALMKKQRDYFETGLIRPGRRCLARVTGVRRDRVSLECFGVDTDLPMKGLSWAWCADLRERYQTGDVLPVQVVSTAKTESGWSLWLTGRDESARPDGERLRRLVPGSTYLGTVTEVSDWEVQARLEVGVNASAEPLPDAPEPRPGDQVAILITNTSQQDQVAYGSVTAVRPRV